MKNVFRLNSMFFFIALLIILTPANIFSQDPYLNFNGYSYRAKAFGRNITKQILKVEITNLENGATVTFNKNRIEKSELITTSVNDNLKDNNSLEIEYLYLQENNLNAVIKSNAERNLSITISDISGRAVNNINANIAYGFSTILIPTTQLSNGFYSIKIGNQTSNLAQNSFIIANNECFLNNYSTKNNSQKLSSLSGYRFVAFPIATHQADTVYVESLDKISQIDFYFKDKGVFNFRTGNIQLLNVASIYETKIISFDKSGNPTDTITKTKSDIVSLNYPLAVDVEIFNNQMYCLEVINTGNNVQFCNFEYNDNLNFSTYMADFLINTNEQNLRIITSMEKSWAHSSNIGSTHYNDRITEFSIKKPINYSIDSKTGILTGEIQINDNDFYYIYHNEASNYNSDLESSYLVNEGTGKCIFYSYIPNLTKIIITLVP
jgi:hypothetical protein